MATTVVPKRWGSQYPELGTEPLPIEPYPFGESPAVFTLERRVVPKRGRSDADFRRELAETPTETVEIRVER